MSRLVVDGYNILHAWPDLARAMRTESLEEANKAVQIINLYFLTAQK